MGSGGFLLFLSSMLSYELIVVFILPKLLCGVTFVCFALLKCNSILVVFVNRSLDLMKRLYFLDGFL